MELKKKIIKRWLKFKYPFEEYVPIIKKTPEHILEVNSAWRGLEQIIEDILVRFDIGRNSCIEFGTEFCYSTVALSNYFSQVKGIDIFVGDVHSGVKVDHFEDTKTSVVNYKNIELIQADYKDYIKMDNNQYDFAHVDIIHTYEDTYKCGLWAIQHSKCCIFHDTESFPEVRKAVYQLAKHAGKKVYNYPFHHGLGIIV